MNRWVIVATVVVIAVVWGALTVSDLKGAPAAAAAAPTATPAVTALGASSIGYEELFRHAGDYVGETVYYEGRASAILSQSGAGYALQVEVTHSSYDAWDDTLYVTCQATGLREGDIIRLRGTVRGRTSYRGTLGNQVTLPWIEATAVEKVAP